MATRGSFTPLLPRLTEQSLRWGDLRGQMVLKWRFTCLTAKRGPYAKRFRVFRMLLVISNIRKTAVILLWPFSGRTEFAFIRLTTIRRSLETGSMAVTPTGLNLISRDGW